MQIKAVLLVGLLGLLFSDGIYSPASATQHPPAPLLIDDFESYSPGGLPTKWKYYHDKQLQPLEPKYMREKEQFYVVEDGNNKVLRVYTNGEAVHLSMANDADGFDWDLYTHPRIAWDWRALRLPPGAKEDSNSLNDTGAGLYVYFGLGGFIIKRPIGIKYSYSSTLPVGTVVSYGKLKVIVVSSGADGLGDWHHIDRDVLADFRQVFGQDPPVHRPILIRLWGDSDNTNSIAEADFDNITLLPAKD